MLQLLQMLPSLKRSADQSLAPKILRVAVPVPLRRCFDYIAPPDILPGCRVYIPFGNRKLVGIAVDYQPATVAIRQLKSVISVIDSLPVFSKSMFELVFWAAQYYHHPIGEAFATALPVALRNQEVARDPTLQTHYKVSSRFGTEEISTMLKRASARRAVYESVVTLSQSGTNDHRWLDARLIKQSQPDAQPHLKRLVDQAILEQSQQPSALIDSQSEHPKQVELNPEQKVAARSIINSMGKFETFLLHGITGSGKTEVYLEAASHAISCGHQVLVLVPEISLTPQLVQRFKARLGAGVCALHSSMGSQDRYKTWWHAMKGTASVVLGTRSAIFTILNKPGLIIVDEEHDISYKQQDGFRYHARDIAIKRASLEQVPIVLGSATPSMESVFNSRQQRFTYLSLQHRTGTAVLPTINTIDLNTHPIRGGITHELLNQIQTTIDNKEQTILYINRRGFAPLVQCSKCGWQAQCESCDAHFIYHQSSQKLRCHHCGKTKVCVTRCPKCQSALFYLGFGTQRIQETLAKAFPSARISRIDRDEVTTQKKLEVELGKIANQEVDIVIGTQLITKGHDFPNVTLVGVINSDHGLYSHDFRSTEYLFQQLVQVAGRSGRGDKPGRVLIQTAHPDNTYLQLIKNQDFFSFSEYCLKERNQAHLPPFGHVALWRAESTHAGAGVQFLTRVKAFAKQYQTQHQLDSVQLFDAIDSPMEKLAGRYRAQLMFVSSTRQVLHPLISAVLTQIEADRQPKVRWSLDIDPMEMF